MSRSFKATAYGELARVGKALASPWRLELLDLLAQAPRSVEGLAGQLQQPLANVSHHLQVLRRARLVEAERSGTWVIYRLASPEVATLAAALRVVGRTRLAELEAASRAFVDARDGLEPLSAAELRGRAERGEVTVLDVRPTEEFRAGHIRGARSVPLEELEQRLADLPADRPVVAYCRGPWCVMAVEAVTRLRERGFDARRLEESLVEWRAAGGAVEVET